MAGELIKAGGTLKIGQRIEIYVGDDDCKYTSRIEDMTDQELVVGMPVNSKGVPVIPLTGEKLYVLAVGDMCRYRFFSSYHGKDKLEGRIAVWNIALPETVERFQNRQFVRVHVVLKLRVSQIDEDGAMQQPVQTTTVDLSGNGVCFSSRETVPIGRRVAMELYDIPDAGILDIMGHVVRCTEVKNAAGTVIYHVGVGFDRVDRNASNRIVRYIFAVQRERIGKGASL